MKSKVKSTTISFETILLFQMLIFIYSYNFHALWLIYDVIILFNIVWLIKKRIFKNYKIALLILLILFFQLCFSFYDNGFHTISLLSYWDTYKHIIFVIFFFSVFKYLSPLRNKKFLNRLYFLSILSFVIQTIFVLYQQNKKIHFDNIAGTFGDGSTHALCYFSLFFIVLIILQKRKLLILPVILISIILNFYAENMGFFVLLPFVLFFTLNRAVKYVGIALIIIVTAINLSSVDNWIANHGFGRITNFSLIKSYEGGTELSETGREAILGYSVFVGGLSGNGYGAYSEIYNKKGWLLDDSITRQICISELTHLISEIGIIGFALTFALYLSVFNGVIKGKWAYIFSISYFTLSILYNRFLMDERIFFFYLLTILIIALLNGYLKSDEISESQFKDSNEINKLAQINN